MAEIEHEDDAAVEISDDIAATEYTIGYSIDDNEMRIQHHNEFGVLSSLILDATGAYEYANRILRAYDKLEGL
jgi:hypothetical protein